MTEALRVVARLRPSENTDAAALELLDGDRVRVTPREVADGVGRSPLVCKQVSSFGTAYPGTPNKEKGSTTPRKTPSKRRSRTREFAFDRVYEPEATTKALFDAEARPLVDSALEGFSIACLAYDPDEQEAIVALAPLPLGHCHSHRHQVIAFESTARASLVSSVAREAPWPHHLHLNNDTLCRSSVAEWVGVSEWGPGSRRRVEGGSPCDGGCRRNPPGPITRYGPTGGGKTHTMLGNESTAGLVGLSVDQLFERMHADTDKCFLLHAS